jgi:hypothetical protein
VRSCDFRVKVKNARERMEEKRTLSTKCAENVDTLQKEPNDSAVKKRRPEMEAQLKRRENNPSPPQSPVITWVYYPVASGDDEVEDDI